MTAARAKTQVSRISSSKDVARSVRQRAGVFAKRPALPFVELARTLSDLEAISPSQFPKDLEGLHVSRSRARCLIRIWTTLGHLAPKERLEKLGITKAGIVAANMTQEKLEKLLRFAETHTVRECQLFVKEGVYYADVRRKTLQVDYEEYEVLFNAVFGLSKKHRKDLPAANRVLRKIGQLSWG